MASRIRNPFRHQPRHRAELPVVTVLRDPHFRPRHCAGELGSGLCLAHDHPGEAPWGVFAGLNEPVTTARPARVPSPESVRQVKP